MRTTLDLPEELLLQAMEMTKIETKTKVITVALQELIRKTKIKGIKDFQGGLDLDLDLDALRERDAGSR